MKMKSINTLGSRKNVEHSKTSWNEFLTITNLELSDSRVQILFTSNI